MTNRISEPTQPEKKLLQQVDPELAAWLNDNGMMSEFFNAIHGSGIAFDKETLGLLAKSFKKDLCHPLPDNDLDQVVGGAHKMNIVHRPQMKNVVIFQKSPETDFNDIPVAWKVIKNVGRSNDTPFLWEPQWKN